MESLPAEISGVGPNVYTTVEKKGPVGNTVISFRQDLSTIRFI